VCLIPDRVSWRWPWHAFVAAAVLTLSAAAPAVAAPPALLSVGQSSGRITASFQLPADGQADVVQVSRRPDVGPDGSFVAIVHEDTLFDDSTWTSRIRFSPGLYYVHVAANDLGCNGCPEREWSAVRPVQVLPVLPVAGLYTGRIGDFGDRISFRVSRGATSVRRVTLKYELECRIGVVRRRHVFGGLPVRNGRFGVRARVRFPGGVRETLSLTGKLHPPRRASGRFKSIMRVPRVGRCKPVTQGRRGLAWSARHR
jgi:hypothetical protein